MLKVKMTTKSADNSVREKFVNALLDKIKGRCTGSLYEKVYDDKPSIKLFIGNLSPRIPLNTLSTIYSKTSPSSAGLEVLINKNDIDTARIRITAGAVFYYKVFPTREEQLEIYNLERDGRFRRDPDSQGDKYDGEVGDASLSGFKLRSVYQKAKPKPVVFEVNISNLIKERLPTKNNFPEGERLATEALEIFFKDENKFRSKTHIGKTRSEKDKELEVTEAALINEETFNAFIRSWGTTIQTPHWQSGLNYTISEFDDKSIKLKLTIDNQFTENTPLNAVDNSMFETQLQVDPINFVFQDYILSYLKDDLNYDGNIHANGFNCTVVKKGNAMEIEHMPIFSQRKYRSKTDITPKFTALSENPSDVLEKISEAMGKEIKRLTDSIPSLQNVSEIGKNKLKTEIDDFLQEKQRFDTSCDILRTNKHAMDAFKLMNAAFANSGKGYQSWRLFQIVFIVMEIADVIASSTKTKCATLEDVDLIYFPTGGGKTEAYLGLAVFTAFYDRLRGKKEGVTAITRFPLRLLSLQQLQRIADIFGQAELLRRQHPIIGKIGYAQFSTGYYVGDENTPNKVYSWEFGTGIPIDNISRVNTDPDLQEKFKIISKCPFCGKNTVKLIGDLNSLRIIHKCTNPECGEEIPVYISDQEVVRYLPTFIVSTLDKMVSASWSKEFKMLFGKINGRCPKHGYISGKACMYHDTYVKDPNACTQESYDPVSLYDPSPTLMIQDEIHLIRESLGTYDSHYESFLDNYIQTITDGKKIKIIGSSATVTDYEAQIRELYLKKAHKFPAYSPFYAYEDQTEHSRFVAGIMPHNKTVIFAVLDTMQIYYEEIENLKANPSLALKMNVGFTSEKEVLETLKDYEIELCYNLAKREGDAIANSILTVINDSLEMKKYHKMNLKMMTGDVTFRDVKEILSTIENGNMENHIDLIIATSMISHGVDIDSLNFMVFMGMPRNTAEYIQALSRIGRKYPGIVFVIFNPTRERDQSYYKYFPKYHEYKDILVEPVPISRWAKFSITRTLPGIFSACVLNYLEGKDGISPYMTKNFKEGYDSRAFTEEDILDFILKCYKVEENEMGAYFKQIISDKVKNYIDQIRISEKNEFIPGMLSDMPMRNLRDTDSPLIVKPTGESFDPMDQIRVQESGGVQ